MRLKTEGWGTKKKRREAGKDLENEMEKPARGRLWKCSFNLLRAYRPGHAAVGRRGAASVPVMITSLK